MDTEEEDILMADEGEAPKGAPATRTSPGQDQQFRHIGSVDGGYKQGQAAILTGSRSVKPLESRSAGQTPRSTSVLANDVAGNLNISTSYSDEDRDELADDDFESKSVVRTDPLPYSKLPSGLCYDVRMRYHCELEPLPDEDGYIPGADPDLHPEDPRRIWSIYRELCHAGLVDDKMSIYGLVKSPLTRIEARCATPAEICLVHTRDHYDFVASLHDMSRAELQRHAAEGDSIYYNKLTWLSAVLSAGGAVETCRAVAARKVRNAIAVIRPPGHHAECDRAMGFCLFNNVCVAARVCQREFGERCRKILIVDWDVHHGNGVQKAFYDDPNVLYISVHVHMDGRFYPGSPNGDHLHCGKGAGMGKQVSSTPFEIGEKLTIQSRNVNIPWQLQGMGDADYMLAFQSIVMPIANEFDPDLVIISAGFDAAAGDTLGGCFVTPACYGHLTHMLMSLADGKVVVCLEGGYNLKSISKSALAVTRTLMGEPPDRLAPTAATASAVATVQKVRLQQSKYWRCLYPKDHERDIQNAMGAERMHDIIRAYQSKHLYDNYKMVDLYIFRERLSKSFENQVLATCDYHKAQPLIVIFHDPPEIMGIPNPVTNKLELHNTWLADVLKDYIEWSVKQGFGVIDVNIPKHITGQEDMEGYVEEDRPKRISATEELAVYLWENYIECNDATEIFFIGVGDAFHGITHLLMNREHCFERITGVITFVAENPLRPVHSQNIYWLSKWYIEHSLIYVSSDHLVWSPDTKKISKRFGRLVKSPGRGLNEMLSRHREEVFAWIAERVERSRGKYVAKGEVGVGVERGGGEVVKGVEGEGYVER